MILFQQQDYIAGPCLKYLWGDDDCWTGIASAHVSCGMLCYFAIAEGYEDLLIEWLSVPRSTAMGYTQDMQAQQEDHAWRGQVLRALMNTHTWHDSGHRADAALNCFFRVRAIIGEAWRERETALHKPPATRISQYPATVVLLQACVHH